MGVSLEFYSIVGIHGDLAGDHPHALAHGAGLGRVDVGLVVQQLKLLRGRRRRRNDFLMVGQFRLADGLSGATTRLVQSSDSGVGAAAAPAAGSGGGRMRSMNRASSK